MKLHKTTSNLATWAACALAIAGAACDSQNGNGDAAAADVEDTAQEPEVVAEVAPAEVSLGEITTKDASFVCPGGAYCACKADTECDSGLCVDTPKGKQCAGACELSCPDGFACAKINGKAGDIINICVAKYGFLCEPCAASKDCQAALGVVGAACVDYGGANGAFCGFACTGDSDCPADYTCGSGTSIEGSPVKQCLRKPAGDGSIQCGCDPRATANGLSSPCKVKAELGNCSGFRACTDKGLQDCSAPKASDETCDGVDNNCNGVTDEGTCDDGNPCTDNNCDGKAKACSNPNNTAACDDKSACTDKDVCKAGKCAGAALDCNDKNACTSDSCDASKGCTHAPVAGACDDFNACTLGDLCKDGACAGGAAKDCNDGNPCTVDLCSGATGCTHDPQAGTCDDGNPCTNGDACSSGKCQPGQNICSCTVDKDCLPNEDGNFCNGTLFCDKTKAPFVCAVDPKTVIACDASKDTACLFNVCEPLTGKCGPKNAIEGKLCNADDSVCTKDDTCKQGICTPGAAVSCDDSNVCTDDLCDPKNGCKNASNIASCDDGNKCTQGDTCGSGQCVSGKKVVCDDKSDCTVDSCDTKTGLCKYDGAPQEGSPCDADGSVCTVGDSCVGGKCTAGKAKVCDDSNICTDDFCDAKSGCQKLDNSAKCEFDNNPCTPNDACKNGTCSLGPKKDCDDKNQCTVDQCEVQTGNCLHIPDPLEGANCEDGDLCTTKDLCKTGKCTAGPAANCDDADTCTTDGCNPLTGCTHQVLADSAPCNDGNACTIKDLCINAKCLGIKLNCDDSNACTNDICGAIGCEHTNVADTTACGTNQWCVGGACKTKGCGDGYADGSAGEQCDDGNALPCDGCESCKTAGYLLLDGKSFATAADSATEIAGNLALDRDLTVEMWVRPDTLAVTQTFVAKGKLPAPTAYSPFAVGVTKGTGMPFFYHLGPEGGEVVNGTVALKQGLWAHVAAVVAGNTVRLFVNGAPAGTQALTKQRATTPGAAVVVGRRYEDFDAEAFTGAIDAIRLSAAPLYGGTFTPVRKPETTADTRALWLFDDPTPATGGADISDGSGFGHVLKVASGKQIAPDACYGVQADVALCGDGKKAAAYEACDDGNSNPCDGCDACRIQNSLVCAGSTNVQTLAVEKWAIDAFCPGCELTAEAWVRMDQNANVSEIMGLSCAKFSIAVTGGKFALIRYGEPPLFGPVVELGKWYHVAGVINWSKGGLFRFYVDGVPYVPTATGTLEAFPALDTKEVLFIGAGGGGGGCIQNGDTVKGMNGWNGAIDHVRISTGMRYTDAFTPPKRPLPDANTRGLWHFDEPAGSLGVTDDSGYGLLTTPTGLKTAADQCLGASGASQCGDGQKAKYEQCDNGALNGPPPKLCSGLCLNTQTPDCTALQASGTALVKGTNTMSYPAAWSVDGWVKIPALPASGTGFIAGVSASNDCPVMPAKQEWYLATAADGSDASKLGGTNEVASKATVVWKAGVWQHFSLQYDGLGKGSLWVDGFKARSFTYVSAAWSTTCPLLIGNYANGAAGPLSLQLASLRLSSKARYGQPYAPQWQLPVDADTIWEFRFDDGAGNPSKTQDTAAKYAITWTSAGSFVADGPKCK